MIFSLADRDLRSIMKMNGRAPTESPARKNGQGGNMRYQDYIREQDCLGCLTLNSPQVTDTQHHHAFTSGVAMRCPDEYSLPLCKNCHDLLHGANQGGKREFIKATELPNFYAPVSNYLIYYCIHRDPQQRAVYYAQHIIQWLQQKQIQKWINQTPYLTRSPI